jgi:RimJ/RimL family protein N-acetyltransferase
VPPPTLTTDRLLLRPLSSDDFDDLAALHAEESYWKYPFGRGWTADETTAFLERMRVQYETEQCAVSAVVEREGGRLAGCAGLAAPTFLPEILPAIEVGWRLGCEFWGRGYATEAGRAWVDYGFSEGGLDEIVSIYEPENAASGAVMGHLGFRLDRVTVHPVYGDVLHVLKLTREEWSDAR